MLIGELAERGFMILRGILALTLVSSAAPATSQHSDAAVRDQFSARYAAMKFAMRTKNEVAIRALLADGFVSVDVDGKSKNASEMIREVLALPSDPNRQSDTKLLSVHTDGDAAVVEQQYEMNTTKVAPDGSERSIALSTLSTDRWINRDGSWRLLRTMTKQIDMSVDGATLIHKTSRRAK